jgi:hypothetical protein
MAGEKRPRRKREPNWPQDVLTDMSEGIKKRVNCAEILRQLQSKYVGRAGDIPGIRTIERYYQNYWKNNPEPDPMDEPFQWHKLEQYGIPWEASGYLLTLWHGIWNGDLERLFSTEEAKRITAREVLWWWRVHLTAPDISPAHTLMWAGRFVNNEIYHLVTDTEPDFEGFYQALAYRSSEGEEQAEAHQRAVEERRIKPASVILMLPPREKERGEG